MKNSYPVVLLAAGDSSRLGTPKGLFPFQGKTWLEWQCARLSEAGLSSVILVVADKTLYEPVIQRIKKPSVELIVNPDPSRGPFSSAQCGLEKVSGAAFLSPLDVPAASRSLWHHLPNPKAQAVVPTFQGRGGHPVWLAEELVKKLVDLPPTSRLDCELHALKKHVIRLSVDEAIILGNLNTKEEFQRLEKALSPTS